MRRWGSFPCCSLPPGGATWSRLVFTDRLSAWERAHAGNAGYSRPNVLLPPWLFIGVCPRSPAAVTRHPRRCAALRLIWPLTADRDAGFLSRRLRDRWDLGVVEVEDERRTRYFEAGEGEGRTGDAMVALSGDVSRLGLLARARSS